MRERSIIWDVLAVGLLFILVLFNGIALLQNNSLEKSNIQTGKMLAAMEGQNSTLIRKLEALATAPRLPSESRQQTSEKSPPPANRSKSYFDETMLPKWVRGDEKAVDGDTLVINEKSEPNSLNPAIDNDATGADLFLLCNDRLATRAFDDLNYFQPQLARGWEKAMICRGVTTQKNARALADKLNAKFDAAAKDKLQIAKIEAESDEVLRIDLSDATGDYRDPILAALGAGALQQQHWIYINFEGDKFTNGGKEINAKSVGELMRAMLKSSPGFKSEFLPDWERENSVVLRLLGSDDVGNSAKAAVEAWVASDKNKGQVTDSKSVTGKTEKKVITLDLIEKYDFEEKPVFTFFLREGVKWHDGETFSGKDVIFSFNTIMNPKVECAPIRSYFQDCEKCELVDNNPNIVRFTWRKPYFLSFNFSAEIYIFPEHVFRYNDAAEFNKTPKNQWIVGTGAYKMERWDRKSRIVFIRNENYYDVKAHFNRIEAKFVAETTVSLQMLLKGDLDIEALTKAQAKLLADDPEFKKTFNMEISVADQFAYLGWNIRRPILSSAKTRRALTMLVDRQRIVDTIMRGYARPLDVPSHPESPAYPKNAKRLHVPFSIAEAKKILAEDGWVDSDKDNVLDRMIDGKRVPFKFTLMVYSGNPQSISIATLVKDTFAQAGIEVIVSNLESSVMQQNMDRLNFDAVISGWRVGTDDDPYQLWHSSQTGEKGSNHGGYSNPEVDRLIENGRRELNAEKRSDMFRRVYEIVAEEHGYTNLYVGVRTVAYHNRIQNVVYKLNGKEYVRWWVPADRQRVK